MPKQPYINTFEDPAIKKTSVREARNTSPAANDLRSVKTTSKTTQNEVTNLRTNRAATPLDATITCSNMAGELTGVERIVKVNDGTIIVETNKDVVINTYEDITEQKYIENITGGTLQVGTMEGFSYTNIANCVNKLGFDSDTGFNVQSFGAGLAKITLTTSASGYSGVSGVDGLSGFSGVSGTSGIPGVSSTIFEYFAYTTTTSGDPGAGNLGWNNPAQTSATAINVNMVTNDGIDIDIFLALLDATEVITLQDKSLSDNFQRFEIVGTPVNNTNYWTIPVALLSSGGTGSSGFPNGQELILALVQGISGASGTSGFSGLGISGYSGVIGSSGYSGLIGASGYSGVPGAAVLDAYCSASVGNGLSGSTGYNNFSLGYNALCSNTTGQNNFAVGYGALQNNNTGSSNIALGNSAGSNITTGSNNTIVGSLSGCSNLTSTILLGAGTCQRLRVDSTGLYINNTDIGSAITLRNIYEVFTSISGATGVVVHDYSLGSIFNHTGMLSNFTVNVTNLNLSTNFVTNIVLVLNQGSLNAYIPSALQINGAAQTIRWVYGALPSGTVNAKDVVNFSFMNVGGVYTVLGQLVSFG